MSRGINFYVVNIGEEDRDVKHIYKRGAWVAQLVKRLPSAQVMISMLGLPAQQGVVFSLSLPLPLPPALSHSRSQNLKKKNA